MSFDPDAAQWDYAGQLWGLSSAIAAFCVLQTLAYVYNFQSSPFRAQIARSRRPLMWVIAFATLTYVAAIGWIECSQIDVLTRLKLPLRDTAIGVAILKCAVVLVFGAGAFCLTYIAEPDPAP